MYTDKIVEDGPFDAEWYQFHTTQYDDQNWVATQTGSTRILTVPITEYKLFGLLVLNRSAADEVTYRILNWYHVDWLVSLISTRENMYMNDFVFNFSRGNSDRRCIVNFYYNDYTKLTFTRVSPTSTDADAYWLVCFGMR